MAEHSLAVIESEYRAVGGVGAVVVDLLSERSVAGSQTGWPHATVSCGCVMRASWLRAFIEDMKRKEGTQMGM